MQTFRHISDKKYFLCISGGRTHWLQKLKNETMNQCPTIYWLFSFMAKWATLCIGSQQEIRFLIAIRLFTGNFTHEFRSPFDCKKMFQSIRIMRFFKWNMPFTSWNSLKKRKEIRPFSIFVHPAFIGFEVFHEISIFKTLKDIPFLVSNRLKKAYWTNIIVLCIFFTCGQLKITYTSNITLQYCRKVRP